MRVAPPMILSEKQPEELGKFSRGRLTAVRVVERERIILLCAEGKHNREIAELLGTTRRTVGLWRRRFVQVGIAGIEKDALRPGRQKPIAEEVVQEVVRKTTQEKPAKGTHWSSRSLANCNSRAFRPSFCPTIFLVTC
jgi:transposase